MTKTVRVMCAALLVAVAAPSANAQGAGFNPPPALMAKFKAWQKWRENHKNISKLTTTLAALRELEKDKATELKKDQAKKILSIFNEWKDKPAMTDEQAQQVNKKISDLMSDGQLQAIATAPNPMQGGRGFGGGAGGQRPGGAGGGMAAMDPAKFPDPKDYNPLNPDTSPFKSISPDRFKEMKGKWNEYLTTLQTRAK